jgi:hypothetical protein
VDGLNAAAIHSAAAVRDFANRLQNRSVSDENPLSDRVAVAVICNDYTQITDIAEIIVKRFASTE